MLQGTEELTGEIQLEHTSMKKTPKNDVKMLFYPGDAISSELAENVLCLCWQRRLLMMRSKLSVARLLWLARLVGSSVQQASK